ncbi:hypothetical protein PENDEC_c023G02009 [Penicillium decumbens]|uniref:beta-glucosidase n=1 Tax=Penicillium decumbens TaxID=69771 RepID=A0A1V6P0P1_PENDC|nr:hypothetical protein PENDEC_c023G02009 [Penicillium decumbens]
MTVQSRSLKPSTGASSAVAVAKGSDDRAGTYAKARKLVSQMTNEEKSNFTYGHASTTTGWSGIAGSIPRHGFPSICFQDARNGIRDVGMVNTYPAGLHVGASCNP